MAKEIRGELPETQDMADTLGRIAREGTLQEGDMAMCERAFGCHNISLTPPPDPDIL